MEALRRTKYLNALGVVQYRRRSLSVIQSVPEVIEGVVEKPVEQVQGRPNSKALSEPAVEAKGQTGSKPAGKISDIFSKDTTKGEANELVQELEKVHDDLSQAMDNQNLESSQAVFGFDLFVWRADKVLVLEFSQAESEDASLKHLLTNNILRALWPQNFAGVELHQHSWPMQGVASDISSATEWLNSLVAGHLHQQSHQEANMPIWVMGETGLKMLFPDLNQKGEQLEEQAKPNGLADIIGTSIHHEKLGVELIISPSLKQISESAVAKAQIWQLLKSIR